MQIRSENPFPTRECADDGCTATRPESARCDLCVTCQNFTQTFGVRPSEAEEPPEIVLRRNWLFDDVVSWRVEVTVNGETECHGPFSEERAKRAKRRYKSARYAIER